MKQLVVINLGSTSTKIAYFQNEHCVFSESVSHSSEELNQFSDTWEQYDYRKQAILSCLSEQEVLPDELDAIVSRGGHTEPLHSGVYRITPKMLEQSSSMKYGNHASDLGIRLAYDMARDKNNAFIVDSPCTDEFEPLARYSGLPEMPRISRFHVLNHKASARQYCRDHYVEYQQVNLIVAHLGGGISVAAHKHGKLIDGNNGLDGDGPFSTNRTGTLPVGALVDMCFSGQFTREEIRKKINGLGGLMAYVKDNNVLAVCQRAIAGDNACQEAIDAMIYQIAKEIGSAAAVLSGDVKAIVLTGGIAYNEYIIDQLRTRVEFIAPVFIYPGEWEMFSLGTQSYYALTGRERIYEL